jgi:hypothetical protein
VIRNVTAIATADSSVGIEAQNATAPGEDQQLTVTNSIARGEPNMADVAVVYGPMSMSNATITIDHSNFGFESFPSQNDRVVDAGGNQRPFSPSDPLQVQFAAPGDFHQASTSPTIDAGVTSADNGATDFDGDPRALGASTDIGADEFVPSPPVDPGDPGDPGNPPAGSADLLSLELSPRRFVAAGKGPSVRPVGRSNRKAAGTIVTFRLSAEASVRFTVERRTKHGRSAARFVPVRGGFDVAGRAGQNSFRFTGRVGGRTLRPGSYRLVGDAGTEPRNATFRVVRKRPPRR